ncbi:MAG TPA: hypothetical protein VKP69_29360 [Isosphaeraceae bacterium]|nr:hypothetical protein [Isosphaeraceae bacterium]
MARRADYDAARPTSDPLRSNNPGNSTTCATPGLGRSLPWLALLIAAPRGAGMTLSPCDGKDLSGWYTFIPHNDNAYGRVD